ncbi:SIMPL domain-containing protein [Virgibacillus byunsanensis]|uniref:SIMPL domain-containing protein n=1 Tax=Virgibacillus byunsanensis TaxID=570945 RepID=A0ABW3LT65_9BACI
MKGGMVVYYPYVQQHNRQQSGIMKVTGNGSVSIKPHIVNIQLEVITENDTLSQAQQENATIMNQVIQALLQLGINRENIQTVGYTINPRYDYPDGTQVFRGYEVNNTINVEITDINQAGNMIDVAVENGVNRVSNIQFTVRNRDMYYQQALRAALENAQAKAQTIAESMQLNLNPVPVKIFEKVSEEPITYKTFAATEQSIATPIEPGQIIIEARVEAEFQY